MLGWGPQRECCGLCVWARHVLLELDFGLGPVAVAQGPELAAPSPPPASSIAAPSKEGICGSLHRWSGMRATRIGERALSILQW